MPREINIHDPSRRMRLGDVVFDEELNFLRAVLEPVQGALDKVRSVSDPESHGFLDTAEYLVGVMLVAVQKYLVSSCRAENITKSPGLRMGPTHGSGEFAVTLLNKAANAWKHRDEWDWEDPPSPTKAQRRKAKQRDDTAAVFDLLSDSEHWYPFSNVAYNVLGDLSTKKVVQVLTEWRDTLEVEGDKQRVETKRLVEEAVAGHLDGLLATAPPALDCKQLAKALGTSTIIVDRLRREGCPVTPVAIGEVISWLREQKGHEHRL